VFSAWLRAALRAIAVDAQANTYVTGSTDSTAYPTTPDAFDSTCGCLNGVNGATDAVLTKLNPAGSGLAYSTYLGGQAPDGNRAPDSGYAIPLDGGQNAYVVGLTGATDFPTTPGAYDRSLSYSGDLPSDAFISKFSTVAGFPRPKGATPLRASLTIAYQKCDSPSREHGPPLVTGSCFPPQMTSQYLTVGTGDANGMLPRSEGAVRFDVVPDKPATPADESDVKMNLDMSDVFTQALADYAGELRASVSVQLTDKVSTPGPVDATAVPFTLGFSAPCTPTDDTTVGSVCGTATTANAVAPGLVVGGNRALWQLGQVEVYDGGSDSDGDTLADNTLFANEGIFAP
jgi:hypothetical protein